MLGSDLLHFPSLAEGLGMVAVEAQAAGLRVLASDSTPRECVVVAGLVDFLPLNKGENVWAGEILNLLDQPRPDAAAANAAVENSPFSIANSAGRLLGLYRDRLE
jgi:glycosyltransferase involved in cell wall biosynthesis